MLPRQRAARAGCWAGSGPPKSGAGAASWPRRSTAIGRYYVHARLGRRRHGPRSLLFNDSEVDVITCDPALAPDAPARLWRRLEQEHVAGDPRGRRALTPIASGRCARREPASRSPSSSPALSRRSRRLIGPLPTRSWSTARATTARRRGHPRGGCLTRRSQLPWTSTRSSRCAFTPGLCRRACPAKNVTAPSRRALREVPDRLCHRRIADPMSASSRHHRTGKVDEELEKALPEIFRR